MSTERVIQSLVQDLRAVRRLPATGRRLSLWLAFAVPPIALIVALMGVRNDLWERLGEGLYLAEMLVMVATGLIGGYGALAAGIPGTCRRTLLAPIVPLGAWIGLLAFQYGREWREVGATFWLDFHCIPAIAVISLVPIATMVSLIRRGSPDRRAVAVLWGTLAAAALANVGLRLFHPVDSALMVIAWQFGTVVVLTGLATAARGHLVPNAPARTAGSTPA